MLENVRIVKTQELAKIVAGRELYSRVTIRVAQLTNLTCFQKSNVEDEKNGTLFGTVLTIQHAIQDDIMMMSAPKKN